MTKGWDAVGIGLAVRDITVEVKDFPKADQKIPARSFHESGGGPVPTALVTLSRLGRRTMLSSVVGHDPVGETIRRNLDDEGVDVGAVVSRDTFRSPTSVIVVENGRRTIFEAPASSGGLPLSWPEVESRLPLNDSRSLLLDARLPDIQLRAAARAREAGALVVLDCGHPREGVDELLALSDVAILSHTYPQTLHGDDFDEEAFVSGLVERIAPNGAGVAGLTLGARGCLLQSRDTPPMRIPDLVVDALDTTGAGDVFHARFVHAFLAGRSLEEAGRFANVAAALKCKGMTGRAPLPPEAAIWELASRP